MQNSSETAAPDQKPSFDTAVLKALKGEKDAAETAIWAKKMFDHPHTLEEIHRHWQSALRISVPICNAQTQQRVADTLTRQTEAKAEAIILLDSCELSTPFIGELVSDLACRLQQQGYTCCVAMPSEVAFESMADVDDDFRQSNNRHIQYMKRTGKYSHAHFDHASIASRLSYIEKETGYPIELLPPARMERFGEQNDYMQTISNRLKETLLTEKNLRLYQGFIQSWRVHPDHIGRALSHHKASPHQKQVLEAMAAIAQEWGRLSEKSRWDKLSLRDHNRIPPAAMLKAYDKLRIFNLLPEFQCGGKKWYNAYMRDLGEDAMITNAENALQGSLNKPLVFMLSNDGTAMNKFQNLSRSYGESVIGLNTRELVHIGRRIDESLPPEEPRFFQRLTPEMQDYLLGKPLPQPGAQPAPYVTPNLQPHSMGRRRAQ